MKHTKISHGSNLMWEGSRMMLPEHVEAIKQHYRDLDKQEKPEFDEQYLNELARQISQAKHEQYTVKVAIFDEYEDISLTGRIISIDQQLRRIRIDDLSGEPVWIYFEDILSIEKGT